MDKFSSMLRNLFTLPGKEEPGIKNFQAPWWNFLFIILPQAIMLLYSHSILRDIKAQLEAKEQGIASLYLTAMLVWLILITGYSLFLWIRKRENQVGVIISNFVVYLIAFYLFSFFYLSKVVFKVEEWILNPFETFLTMLTFFMGTFVYSIGALISRFREKEGKAWLHFVWALLIPAGFYIFFQVIIPLIRYGSLPVFVNHLVAILVILSTALFFFLVVRGGMIIYRRMGHKLMKIKYLLRVLTALVFPVVALVIYQFGDDLFFGARIIFGDFSNPWFMILASINGVLLILPAFQNRNLRLLLLLLRSMMFPFSAYFFLAFLPYLPVSVLMIALAGLGILLLSPIFLMLIHLEVLKEDLAFLADYISKTKMALLMAAALLAIPGAVVSAFAYSRMNLHSALDYLYASDYRQEKCTVNTKLLQEALSEMEGYDTGTRLPFLMPLYRHMVFDNLILQENKMAQLKAIFLNRTEGLQPDSGGEQSSSWDTELVNLNHSSRFEQGSWVSHIDLELLYTGSWQGEFRTGIQIPPGVFVSDYYLDVNGKREPGLLVEKSAAQWVYSQIVSRRRDPGIIYYDDRYNGNSNLILKVFPCLPNTPRFTGFSLVHKYPVTIKIGSHVLNLGESMAQEEVLAMDNRLLYVPSSAKKELPKVTRKPVYHFILNCSAGRDPQAEYGALLADFSDGGKAIAAEKILHFTNYQSRSLPYSPDWASQPLPLPSEGGFYPERVIKKILVESYSTPGLSYPVIIILGPFTPSTQYPKDDAFRLTLPDTGFYYHLNLYGRLLRYNLFSSDLYKEGLKVSASASPKEVLPWPNSAAPVVYLSSEETGSPALFSFGAIGNSSPAATLIPDSVWEKGLLARALWLDMQLNPGQYEKKFINAYKTSLSGRVLSPVTSFMVVEDEAQKRGLLKKQDEILEGKKYFSPGEKPESMSEPEVLLFAVVAAAFLLRLFWKKRKRNLTTDSTRREE